MRTRNPFVNLYLLVQRRWTRCKSLSEQAFWLTSAGVAVVLISYLGVNIVRHSNPFFLFVYLGLILYDFISIFIAYKTKKYGTLLSVLFVVIICVINPFCFFAGGGFESSTVIISLLPMLILWMHDSKKMRIILTGLNLFVVPGTYALALIFPDLVNHPQIHTEPGMIAATVIVAISILLVQYFIRNAERKKEEERYREIDKRNEIKIALLKKQLESVEDVRRMRHDMRHHNAIIAEFAKDNDTEGLLEYLKKKKDYDDSFEKKIFCMNELINNILTVYDDMAFTEKIDMDIYADVSNKNLPYNDAEMVVLFANIIENAIHGAQKSERRKVSVDIREKNDKILFVCKNTCNRFVEVEKGMLKNPGTGVSSIMRFVRLHGCTIDYSLSDDEITCTIILNTLG